MTILALTQPSAYAKHCDLPQMDLAAATPDALVAHDVVVICPERMHDSKPHQIIKWKRQGRLGETKLIFGTYKGIHYWSQENDPLVERWVVHTRSEIFCKGSQKMRFVPLALTPGPSHPSTGYVFCGGRKARDFGLAGQAIGLAGFPAKFATDRLPPGLPANAQWYGYVPIQTYQQLIGKSAMTVVPVKVGDYSHGHSDVVRSLLAGKPVVVTRGGSCDDYIEEGVNGLLVDPTPGAFAEGIQRVMDNLDEYTDGARSTASRHSFESYNRSIRALIEEVA